MRTVRVAVAGLTHGPRSELNQILRFFTPFWCSIEVFIKTYNCKIV
jgi:hypothetical protein